MRINLTLQQLEAFVQVATTVNFRAAAQALHVSQPALSRTIKMIEDTIGARLFDRDTRHVAVSTFTNGRPLSQCTDSVLPCSASLML